MRPSEFLTLAALRMALSPPPFNKLGVPCDNDPALGVPADVRDLRIEFEAESVLPGLGLGGKLAILESPFGG